MGGREVGGLCAGLPGYRTVTNEEHRREVESAWRISPGSISPEPGLPATEMFRSLDDGDVRLMWVVATNPAASMPDLARTKRALEKAPFLVVSDAYPTETTKYADLILPAAQWGEKEGTMTSSERRVSLVEKSSNRPEKPAPTVRFSRRSGGGSASRARSDGRMPRRSSTSSWDSPAALRWR
jgi:ferredoxin-nitrate reductase